MKTNEHDYYSDLANWSFEDIDYTSEVFTNWIYEEEIKKRVNENSRVLDLGTAAGEKVLKNFPDCAEILGTDFSSEMIESELQLAYAIGVAQPVAVFVDSFGTGKLDDEKIAKIVMENFDMRPAAMIDHLGLRAPIYKQTAAYGHMGRPDLDLPWERLNKVEDLKNYL